MTVTKARCSKREGIRTKGCRRDSKVVEKGGRWLSPRGFGSLGVVAFVLLLVHRGRAMLMFICGCKMRLAPNVANGCPYHRVTSSIPMR